MGKKKSNDSILEVLYPKRTLKGEMWNEQIFNSAEVMNEAIAVSRFTGTWSV